MLCKAGQTAGPIGLEFFVDTHGHLPNFFSIFFFPKKILHGQRRAL